jgi:hypothetical protein
MARRTCAVVVAVWMVLGFASAAKALFHLAVIDEVLTSYGGDPNAQFIEMRMLANSQNFVANSVFAAFDTTGAYVADILVVPSNVANSGNGVRWLIGTSAFQTASGLAPDFVMPAGILPTAGGMVCFGGGGGALPANPPTWSRTTFTNYVDCVAYGTYAGPPNILTGTPTTLNGDGHSLQRSTNTFDNAADFICGDPATPQNNAGVSASMPATAPCPVATPTATPTATATATPTGMAISACPAAPDGACVSSFAKGLLLVKDAPAGKQKLLAKLIGGPALNQTDLGNPLSSGGTAYDICLYNDSGGLVGQLQVDRAGDTCSGVPCWKALGGAPPTGKGYKYKDKALSANGILQILYKGGAAGKSKALIKGNGAGLPPNMAAALQSSLSATVQLHGSDAPQCLSLTVTDIKKQDPTFFKAKK